MSRLPLPCLFADRRALCQHRQLLKAPSWPAGGDLITRAQEESPFDGMIPPAPCGRGLQKGHPSRPEPQDSFRHQQLRRITTLLPFDEEPQNDYLGGEGNKKKAHLKRTADMLEKLAIAGIALALWQQKTDMAWLAGVFLALCCFFAYWEAKQ